MAESYITIRAKLPNVRDRNGDLFPPTAFSGMVQKMNDKAKQGRLLGQLDAPYDGKTRLGHVSHKVLPDAKVNDDGTVSVSIQALDTPMGRQLMTMLAHSPHRIQISSRGVLRGVGSSPEDVEIVGVDLDFRIPEDWTVLDGIVDALNADDK